MKDRIMIFKNGEESSVNELSPDSPMPEVAGEEVEAVLVSNVEVRMKPGYFIDDEEAWAIYRSVDGAYEVTVGAPTIREAVGFLLSLQRHPWTGPMMPLEDLSRSQKPRDQLRYHRWLIATGPKEGVRGDVGKVSRRSVA